MCGAFHRPSFLEFGRLPYPAAEVCFLLERAPPRVILCSRATLGRYLKQNGYLHDECQGRGPRRVLPGGVPWCVIFPSRRASTREPRMQRKKRVERGDVTRPRLVRGPGHARGARGAPLRLPTRAHAWSFSPRHSPARPATAHPPPPALVSRGPLTIFFSLLAPVCRFPRLVPRLHPRKHRKTNLCPQVASPLARRSAAARCRPWPR